MKHFVLMAVICIGVGVLAFTNRTAHEQSKCVPQTLAYFKAEAALFSNSTSSLESAISKLKRAEPKTLVNAKEALKQCRLQYKSIEFFLNYFFPSSSLIYNAPNTTEVEEPFMEYREPTGLQVIETMLFADDPFSQKKDLLQQAALIKNSASDIHALLYNLQIDDKQILESIRLELVRLITLGITGYDAPELKTGITESGRVLVTMQKILSPLLVSKSRSADRVLFYLQSAITLTRRNTNFDTFDRLGFLTKAALPLQYNLNLLIKENGLDLNTSGVLNYDAKNIFSADAIRMNHEERNEALISLGQKLFFEKGLSGNSTRSCATCHQPAKYFADQIPKSITLDGHSTVERNAPSLFYSAFQHTQFWDGRVKTLDEQINTVLVNPIEMGADHKVVVKRLRNTKQYVESFNRAFPVAGDTAVSIHNISLSITAFLESLAPLNSPFDKYMQGAKTAMTTAQMKGFNLFMGKAQCGTCHFAPIFNGLIPPLYKRTELEVLGVTKDKNFNKPKLDADNGRYNTFPIIFYKGAFKTPTVRNAAKTAPYMHNGAFPTLEKVIEFYNKGGGAGLGLDMPTQTLSPKPLKLTNVEISEIVAFINSLTDAPPDYLKN